MARYRSFQRTTAEQLALDTSETLPQHKAMSRCRLSHDPLSLTQTLPGLFGLPLQPTVDRCSTTAGFSTGGSVEFAAEVLRISGPSARVGGSP